MISPDDSERVVTDAEADVWEPAILAGADSIARRHGSVRKMRASKLDVGRSSSESRTH